MYKRVWILLLVIFTGLLAGCTLQSTAEASLILYSGMPDPTWQLSKKQLQEFNEQLKDLPSIAVGEEPSYLGYRGIYVFPEKNSAESQTIRVTDEIVIVRTGDNIAWYADTGRKLERWLLETGKPHVKESEYQLALHSFSTGFAIYLLDGDTLQDEPLIAEVDVISYNPDTYELTITEDAYARYDALVIAVQGMRFSVTVNDSVIYTGTFCTPISSLSNEGIVIEKWLPGDEPILRFQLSYPESPDLFEGEDLRNATEILDAFRYTGKLKE